MSSTPPPPHTTCHGTDVWCAPTWHSAGCGSTSRTATWRLMWPPTVAQTWSPPQRRSGSSKKSSTQPTTPHRRGSLARQSPSAFSSLESHQCKCGTPSTRTMMLLRRRMNCSLLLESGRVVAPIQHPGCAHTPLLFAVQLEIVAGDQFRCLGPAPLANAVVRTFYLGLSNTVFLTLSF
jgi:hypothetical protein